jgi:hypothetical protein
LEFEKVVLPPNFEDVLIFGLLGGVLTLAFGAGFFGAGFGLI